MGMNCYHRKLCWSVAHCALIKLVINQYFFIHWYNDGAVSQVAINNYYSRLLYSFISVPEATTPGWRSNSAVIRAIRLCSCCNCSFWHLSCILLLLLLLLYFCHNTTTAATACRHFFHTGLCCGDIATPTVVELMSLVSIITSVLFYWNSKIRFSSAICVCVCNILSTVLITNLNSHKF